MSRSRFVLVVALSLASSFAVTRSAVSQQILPAAVSAKIEKATCCTYHLGELADDPNFAKWIADTLPEVIRPGTWNQSERVARCYGPARILVVTHTPAVQAEVDAFLKSLRSAMPQARTTKATSTSAVMPALHLTATPLRAPEPVGPRQLAYPVPAASVQPKHLFHFIIRYEGEGSLSAPLAEVVKSLNGGAAPEEKTEAPQQAAVQNASSPGQAFQVILRYEGDGLIDSTVAGVIKGFYDASMGQASGPMPSVSLPPPPFAGPLPPGFSGPFPPATLTPQAPIGPPPSSTQPPSPNSVSPVSNPLTPPPAVRPMPPADSAPAPRPPKPGTSPTTS